MGLSGCYAVMKYLVVLVNLVFWLVGLAAVIVAIWMLADPTFYLSMAQTESDYYSGLYVLLAAGVLLVVIAFLGCCGAFKESQCMLVAFFCFLLIAVVAECAGAWWGWAAGERLERTVRDTVTATVHDEYGRVNSRTLTFDAIQKGLECCGANGPQDWAGSYYGRNGKDTQADQSSGTGLFQNLNVGLTVTGNQIIYQLPPSCCKKGINPNICEASRSLGLTASINPSMYSTGCVDKVLDTIRSHMNIVLGVAIAVVIVEILGLIFAIVLCLAIRRSDGYKA